MIIDFPRHGRTRRSAVLGLPIIDDPFLSPGGTIGQGGTYWFGKNDRADAGAWGISNAMPSPGSFYSPRDNGGANVPDNPPTPPSISFSEFLTKLKPGELASDDWTDTAGLANKPKAAGIDTNTLLMIGGGLLLAVVLLKR